MGAPEPFDPLADLRAAGLSVTLDAGRLIVRPAAKLTDGLRRAIHDRRPAILARLHAERAAPPADPARAARFRRALALLAETPGRQVALVTDLDAEPGFVLVTLAFQDRGLIELAILDARYDGADLLRRFLAHYGDGGAGPGVLNNDAPTNGRNPP